MLMLASRYSLLSAVLLTWRVGVTCAVIRGSTSSIAGNSRPSSELCIPFSEEAVASANLTEAEQSILPELCYQPELAPHLFGTEDDRGIPPGVDCTPFQWCTSVATLQMSDGHPGSDRVSTPIETYLAGVTVTNIALQCANVGV